MRADSRARLSRWPRDPRARGTRSSQSRAGSACATDSPPPSSIAFHAASPALMNLSRGSIRTWRACVAVAAAAHLLDPPTRRRARRWKHTDGIAVATPLLLLALAASAEARPLFSAPSMLFDTGGTPASVAIADLNGDGRPDLAVASSGYLRLTPGTVTVLYGNGDGTFGARADFGTGIHPVSVAVADLNGDRFPDLVTANGASNAISVLLGNGDGTFGARDDFGPGIGARSVAIADLNGDGHLDVVTERSVFLGNGDGTFGARIDFNNAGSAVAVGDLNGDGRPDLVTNRGYDPDYDDYVGAGSVLLGNGDGTFQAPIGFQTGLNP